jgi:DNA-binding CsgD family transcriptional regulator
MSRQDWRNWLESEKCSWILPYCSVAHRQNYGPYAAWNSFRGVAMGNTSSPPKAKKISAAQADPSLPNKGVSPPKTTAGFLLMDSALCPVSFNAEAIDILSYPDKLANSTHAQVLLAAKIRTNLVSRQVHGESRLVNEFRSGRRRYFCRAFFLNSGAKDPSHPSIAILLERGPSALVAMSQVSQQFNLTQREREVMEYTLQGLTSTAIANRMNISQNTVRAFLRMIVIKTGVSSRSAVVGKIIMSQPQ